MALQAVVKGLLARPRRWVVTTLIFCAFGFPLLGTKLTHQKPIEFVEVTADAGITFRHVNASSGEKYYVETIGAGCAFLDYDNDGFLAIYLVNGAVLPGFRTEKPIIGALYKNKQDGTFIDVTSSAKVGAEGIYGMGVAAGDYDNDGNVDMYITGFGRGMLYHNQGHGTFVDVTESSHVLNQGKWGTSAAFLDYDRDGYLDLFVGNYVDFEPTRNIYCGDVKKGRHTYCHPIQYKGTASALYHNNRDGTFTDVSQNAGVANPEGKALGVVASDLDGDGWLDIVVANDGVANNLYHNNGDGTFKDVGPFSGAAYSADGMARAGMGVDAADFDHDGDPDILITNFSLEGAALYRNGSDNLFTDVTFQTGLREATFMFTGWGTKFLDYDNDGDLDVFIANGHPENSIHDLDRSLTYEQPKLLLENRNGEFVDVSRNSARGLLQAAGRGAAFGDYDNDGDIDMLVANCNQQPNLLRNSGGGNNWVKLKLTGSKSNRDAVGAKIKMVAGNLVRTEEVKGGSSFLSAHDLRVNFGLGTRTQVDTFEIQWPSGTVQKLKGIKANQIVSVREP
jgi:enediyne biosynthesis protein E4